MDLTENGQFWIKRKLNPGPETGIKAWKFGFKARTKYSVYTHEINFNTLEIILNTREINLNTHEINLNTLEIILNTREINLNTL